MVLQVVCKDDVVGELQRSVSSEKQQAPHTPAAGDYQADPRGNVLGTRMEDTILSKNGGRAALAICITSQLLIVTVCFVFFLLMLIYKQK